MNRNRIAPISLILGLVFFTIGWATNRDIYIYIAIPFLVISLFTGYRGTRKK